MHRTVIVLAALALAVTASACSQSPSMTGPTSGALLSGPTQLASATVTVLDGAPPPSCVQGCTVTQWPLYPVEDWTPTYNRHTAAVDACTDWLGSPGYTYALVDHDADDEFGYLTPPYYWCKQ